MRVWRLFLTTCITLQIVALHNHNISQYSMKSFIRTITAIMAAGVSCAADDAKADFSKLVHHWNFDEGRDWHNMPFPFKSEADNAHDSVGEAHASISEPVNETWISGRQFSGVRMRGGLISVRKNIDTLAGSCSLSFWLRQSKSNKGDNCIFGDSEGLMWGNVNEAGKIGVMHNGKTLIRASVAITDDNWHHVVITRDEKSGELSIYVDGKAAGTAKGPLGKIGTTYKHIGGTAKGRHFVGSLDQIHVFSGCINAATVAALYDNHAPKIYDQEYLVERAEPTRTGSILHCYAYDMEHDSMKVTRFSQGRYGKVINHNDGTFTYIPGEKFKGRDSFSVTVTDGRGGYDEATINVYDDRYVSKQPVEQFKFVGDLPVPGAGNGKKEEYRAPLAIKGKGKKYDLIVQTNGRLWYYVNTSKKGTISFKEPIELKTADGQPLETDGAAVTNGRDLYIRRPNGTVVSAKLDIDEEPHIQLGDEVKDHTGAVLKIPTRYFVITDFDHDKKGDIVFALNNGLHYYKNTGTKKSPAFTTDAVPVWLGSYNVAPGLGDLNNDKRVDLLHGINWGTMSFWLDTRGSQNMISGSTKSELQLVNPPDAKFMRNLNGTHLVAEDFDGDDVPDLIIGGNAAGGVLVSALGIDPDNAKNNLKLIEREFYDGHEKEVGRMLESNDQAGLKRYRDLMKGWIKWAIARPTPAEREKAYNMLKKHVKKYDFLQRSYLKDAWMKKEDGKLVDYGPMHHVPGIFALNWIVLDQLMPDSAAQRKDVADALGMTGVDREYYLASGIPLADNNHCTEGQLRATEALTCMHPRILFPDDHISIDRNFGDEREAMCYVFRSNKNTFGCDVGGSVHEMDGDMVRATELCLEGPGAANGDYYTFVLAHEVCHSLDAYVQRITNQDLNRRWGDILVYAATNAGQNNIIGVREDGNWDVKLTQNIFKEKGLWDGKADWNETWKNYWKQCPYRGKTFMRGDIDWFLAAKQESLATQANHHWARSEARLIGSILRYELGYKANINEVLHYLDILSTGMNKIHMYHTRALKDPNRVDFHSDPAWLVRNDNGYITDVIIGDRSYSFEVDDKGRAIRVKSHPFPEQIKKLAEEIKARKK